MRPIPDQRSRALDLLFPINGISLYMGYSFQPPRTTPAAINVRAFDAMTQRQRGGVRPGLTPFFGQGSTQQVSGTNAVQMLGTVTTVSASAVSGS